MGRKIRQGPKSPGSSGSEPASEPEFLIVGQIIRPHGVRGELAMKALTAYPERLPEVKTLYIGPEHMPYKVRRIRRHHQGVLLMLHGITSREQAEMLREQMVHIHIQDAVPLEDGEYYLFQLENMRVVTDTGEELGRFTGYIETGANDVYIVETLDGHEVLLPAIPDVILQVDVKAKVMTVHLLEGLM